MSVATLPAERSGVLSSVLRVTGALAGASLVLAALAPVLDRATAPTVQRLEVHGDTPHVPAETVRTALAPLLLSSLMALDLEAIRGRVEALPWVAEARVERAWPGTVRVSVGEHRAVAVWKDSALLSAEGRVFAVPTGQWPQGLPQLAGPPGSEQEVMRAHQALIQRLADTVFAPVQLVRSERGDWTARTAAGVELRLGRGNPADKVARIAEAVTGALAGRLAEIEYVDLRYSNGFAVGWASQRDTTVGPPSGGLRLKAHLQPEDRVLDREGARNG